MNTIKAVISRQFGALFAGFAVLFGGLALAGGSANAQTPTGSQGDIMVVFDGSGSMRGRVKGGRKIDVSKKALAKVINRWSDRSMNVGMIAYGHNRKKDCADIETLVKPGPLDSQAFEEAIDKIKAVGNTPLTASVQKAAEALNYTSRRATVILMSDGRENCDRDPCALARALEVSGAAFTAHVIALAVKKKDEAGLRCLAEETGGRYVLAKNAEDLLDAFFEMGAAQPMTFEAIHKRSRKPAKGPIKWLISNDSTQVERTTKTAQLELASLSAGTYKIAVTGDGGSVETNITVPEGKPSRFEIELEGAKPEIGFEGPSAILTLETFSVRWFGPNAEGDRIEFARKDADGETPFTQSYRLRDYARGGEGLLTFKAPLRAGQYELRYIAGDDDQLLERRDVTVRPVSAP